MQFQPQQSGSDQVDFATEVGRSFGLFGKELDQCAQKHMNHEQIQAFIDGCVNKGDPDEAIANALEKFIDVAKEVFEVDERGLGMASIDDHVCICFPVITLHCPTYRT